MSNKFTLSGEQVAAALEAVIYTDPDGVEKGALIQSIDKDNVACVSASSLYGWSFVHDVPYDPLGAAGTWSFKDDALSRRKSKEADGAVAAGQTDPSAHSNNPHPSGEEDEGSLTFSRGVDPKVLRHEPNRMIPSDNPEGVYVVELKATAPSAHRDNPHPSSEGDEQPADKES